MARLYIEQTRFDDWIARAIAQHTSRTIEQPAKAATFLADEHLLMAAVAGYWLGTRLKNGRERQRGNHLVANVAVTAIVPHILKTVIAQKRPDRCVIHGKRKGIPKSGKPYDAFPSGHAMHIGAVASALTRYFPKAKPVILGGALLVAATRVVLLAHWTTDVLVGLGSGVAIEHLLWLLSQTSQDISRHS